MSMPNSLHQSKSFNNSCELVLIFHDGSYGGMEHYLQAKISIDFSTS
jgi:hypothetical protein